MLDGMQTTDNVGEDQNNRSFDLNAKYKVKITVPYCRSFEYVDKIELYLNENKIYEKDYQLV